MYEVNEKEILKIYLINDLCETYSMFENMYKSSDLTKYLDFFWQVYYSLMNSNYSIDEFDIQYIFGFEKFDSEIFDILFCMFQSVVKKYGIRMDRTPSKDKMCIYYNKEINNKVYFVDSLDDLEWIKKSLVA